MNEHAYVIVIFGASGDLSKKKLLPALYNLIRKNSITNFCIIGTALDKISSGDIMQATKPYIQTADDVTWQHFAQRFFYQTCNFKQSDDYTILKQFIDAHKKTLNIEKHNTLVYFAVAAHFFCDITQHIAQANIATASQPHDTYWTRLVYEKPFGHNLVSAQKINDCIATYFNEDQIYRIDHYLTKELVSNIALVRFTNIIFEPLWNNRYIDNVQIILSEDEGIGKRGSYYDHFGALSDVVQNHMLELLALIGMEAPKALYGDYVRDQRAKVLANVSVVDAFYGQYEQYRQEPFINKDSNTETFAVAYLRINNPRWAGVPFYLKTGKCLNKKETTIHIKFKSVDCLLASCSIDANVLTIEISPKANFALRLNAKKPGEDDVMIPITMEFCHSCIFGNLNDLAYETLLSGVIKGEQSVSVRFDEIEYAWKIIDALKQEQQEVYSYTCGSSGPKELEKFNKKHGIRWLS